MKRASLLALCCLFGFSCLAEVVNGYEETECGGVTVRVAERMLATGRSYRTAKPPAKNGWIFTHWTISTDQDFENRDVWGRAFDEAPFKLYEKTTLTAHYLPVGTDSDNDGVADGREIYWYGDLSQNAASDTDGDGLTFAEELANGSSPLMADGDIEGPVKYADSELHEANLQPYEMVDGLVADGRYVVLADFGGAVTPTVADVDGDGILDIVVEVAGGETVTAILPSSNARVGLAVRTPDEPPENPKIVVPYSRGDMDGNGRLEKADLDLLAKLMKAKFRRLGIVNGGVKLEVLE